MRCHIFSSSYRQKEGGTIINKKRLTLTVLLISLGIIALVSGFIYYGQASILFSKAQAASMLAEHTPYWPEYEKLSFNANVLMFSGIIFLLIGFMSTPLTIMQEKKETQ